MSTNKKSSRPKRFDPDARFLLANERTLLAWVRTALAVMGGGVALTQIGGPSTVRTVTGLTAIMLGGFMVSIGYVRFKAADKAIRLGRLPTTGNEPLLQIAGIIVIALALVIARILGIWR